MPEAHKAFGRYLSVQSVELVTDNALLMTSRAIWVVLFAIGVWGGTISRLPKVSKYLAIVLLGQLLLSIVFGQETFLYSLHYGPLLVAVTSLGIQTPARQTVVLLAAALVVFCCCNNLPAFINASSQLQHAYQADIEFNGALESLTEKDGLVIHGVSPAIAEGVMKWKDPRQVSPGRLGRITANRRGWLLFYDDWSIEMLEDLRKQGADYFITSYAHGLQERSDLFRIMEEKYYFLEKNALYAIILLHD
jgi:hypothetical protein